MSLTGGVLYKGESNKDLDLIITPLKMNIQNQTIVMTVLNKFNIKFVRLVPVEKYGDLKTVCEYSYKDKRIDIMWWV